MEVSLWHSIALKEINLESYQEKDEARDEERGEVAEEGDEEKEKREKHGVSGC